MANLTDVQAGIGALMPPGQLTEMRLLLADGKWVGFYFNDHARLAAAACEMDTMPDDVRGIYMVFNPIKRSVLEAPRVNFYLNPSDKEMYGAILNPNKRMWPLTTNDDIELIEWAMVDVDTVRAAGFEHESATASERKAAAEIADKVIQFCAAMGCTDPVLASSGNGWHALYRVHLANRPENLVLVASFLRTLGFKYSNARVAKIDQAVKNAARLTRAYGTTTRKGTNTAQRPWRMNKVLDVGSDVSCPRPVLEAIAALSAPGLSACSSSGSSRRPSLPKLHEEFDADEFADWVEEVWPVADDFEKNGTRLIVLNECLNAEVRHRGDPRKSAFLVGESLGYKCFSDDCEGFTIGVALSKLASLHGEPYPGEIFADDLDDVEWDELELGDSDDLE